MSSTIDNRVVEMQFNNAQFESNVKTSLNTIAKLKQSLSGLSGSSSGLDEISASAKNVDMSPISSAVETVSSKFSAFEVVAITALANITNSAIDAGTQLIKSLSVDQISEGWEKFASKTQSVGTLISQGYDLETVNEQLERLNWYTDETSYNFTDMVANIAKFTASGQDLETSVTAMEGIANWAALSGQNATTASSAMYQLAQAMSAGYMRLEDYKSIQNASMDTEEFRQKCLDAAVALGTLQDNADGTYTSIVDGASSTTFTLSSFTTSLTEGAWLTSDVMMDVFNTYSGAVDDIYEYAAEKGITASEAIEELGDSVDEFGLKAFKAAQEARSWADVVDSVKDAVSTGWMNTFELIFGDYEEATELWTDLANAMYDVFAAGAEDRNAMLETWKELGGRTVLIDTFWTAWENVGEILGTVKEAFREVFPSTTAEQLYAMTEGLQTLVEKFKMSEEGLANLKSTFKGAFAVLDIVVQAVKAIAGGFASLISYFAPAGSGFLSLTGSIGDFLYNLDATIKDTDLFNTAVGKVVELIKTGLTRAIEIINQAVSAIKEFASYLKEKFDIPDLGTVKDLLMEFVEVVKEKFATPGFDLLKSVLEKIHDIAAKVVNVLGDLKERVTESFSSMDKSASGSTFLKIMQTLWQCIKQVASAISGALGNAMSSLSEALSNANIDSFFDVLSSLITGGLLVQVIQFVKSLKDGFKGLDDVLKNVSGILKNVGEVLKSWSLEIKASALLEIAGAVGILAAALLVLSGIDGESLATAITAITSLFAEMAVLMTVLSNLNKTSTDDKYFGIFSSLTNLVDSFSAKQTASQMLTMAAAITVLAVAMTQLAELDVAGLVKGVAGIAAASAILVQTFKSLSTEKATFMVGGSTMVLFAAAIEILAMAAKTLGSMDLISLIASVTAIGTLSAIMVASFKTLSSAKRYFVIGGASMIAFSAAIEVLALACKTLSSIGLEALIASVTAIGTLSAIMVASFKVLSSAKESFVVGGASMIAFSAAIEVLALACRTLSGMGLESMIESVASIGVLAGIMVAAFKILSSKKQTFVAGGTSMIAFAAAIEVLALACKTLSNIGLTGLIESLSAIAVILVEMVATLKILSGLENVNLTSTATSILVMAAAIDVLALGLKAVGNMSVASIAKSLITLAAAFTILGVAGSVLAPLAGTILILSEAFALIGAGTLALGAGLLIAGAGLSALAVGLTAFVAACGAAPVIIVGALVEIIEGVAGTIPVVIEKIGEGLILLCEVIAESAPTIGEAFKAVVLTLVDVLVECVPAIADGALQMISEVLASLAEYGPQIADSLLQFLIGVLNSLADNLPELIQAAMNVIGAFFQGVIDALGSIDVTTMLEAIVAIGLMSGVMAALSAVSSLVPGAMVGVLGMGAVIAELALVLAAIGALAQLPGLTWLINEGGDLLEGIGTAIGKFVGGIVGGFLNGITSQFAKIGSDLSEFMVNVTPFIEGASKINSSTLEGVSALAEAVILLTAADLVQGIASWLTGGSSIVKFGQQLAEFGPYFSDFSDSIKDIDGAAVEASANAAEALAEFAMKIPNQGGIVSWFTGDNKLAKFGEALAEFGPYLKSYADSVEGLDADVVENSVNAAEVLSGMAKTLPNQGGLVSWFTGDNTLANFGEELAEFGKNMKKYANNISGIDPDMVTNSANAVKAIAEFASELPNQGGLVSWFTGDNTLSVFGEELAKFGKKLKKYGNSVSDLDSDVVINSANAAKALAEFASELPNQGGLVSWFVGDNTLSSFGNELAKFGKKMKSYGESVSGLDPDVVINSANAAKALFEMVTNLPDSDAIATWITGGVLTDFGYELVNFGPSMTEYANSVSGLKGYVVTASANAAKALFEMMNNLPDQNGCLSWFTGGTLTLSKAGQELAKFGPYLMEYADSVTGLKSNVVNASAYAAKVLFKMTESLPDQSGCLAWFTGGTLTLSKFGKELAEFGPYMMEYANSVTGLKSYVVTSSANAAKALLEITENLPNQNGCLAWFTGGEMTLSKFGKELAEFGPYMMEYANSVTGLKNYVVTASTNAAKALFEMVENLPDSYAAAEWFTGSTITLSTMASELAEFGPYLMAYADSVTGLKSYVVTASANAAKAIFEMVENLPDQGGISSWFTGSMTLSEFGAELAEFGPSLAEYANSISDVDSDAVTGSANAAKALAEFVSILPSTGGLSSLFSGDASLSNFGEQLVVFGSSLAQYSDEISDIETDTLSSVTAEVGKLIDLLQSMSGMDMDAVGSFSNALSELGKTSVNEFILAFTDSYTSVKNAAVDLLATFIEGVDSKKDDLSTAVTSVVDEAKTAIENTEKDWTDAGHTLIVNLTTGVQAEDSTIYDAVDDIISTVTDTIFDAVQDFKDAGTQWVNKLVSGIDSNSKLPSSKFTSIVSTCVSTIKSKYDDFYSAGKYLVQGFANGIDAYTYLAKAKAKAMANAAAEAAAAALDEHSPSKVLYKIGAYGGIAFVNALDDYATKSYDAGENMAVMATDGLSAAFSSIDSVVDDMDYQPTIRPVFDMSDIYTGVSQMDSLFRSANGYDISGSVELANQTLQSMNQAETNRHDSAVLDAINILTDAIEDLENTPSQTFENTFNINGADDPKAIAQQVSIILQRQVERRNASWA